MNIIIEEIVTNPLIQIEEAIQEISIPISEMQMPGKSAYQSALDGGFIGTELDFNESLADVLPHISNLENPHQVTKTQVGLSEVDNTSDVNKPLSSATETALSLKVDKVAGERLINADEIIKISNQSGVNTGDETASTIINKIGDGSKINQSYLPSYVDDILEFDTVALFPVIGEIGKIYIVTTGADINKQYRWTGSVYTQITNGLIASTNDVPEGLNNLYFTNNRVLTTLLTGVSFLVGTPIVSTDSILEAFGKLQKQITDGFTATNIRSILGITTLSGSNTGDQNLTTYVKNIIKDAVPTTPITGTTVETIFNSYLIPANTFSANDMMKIPYFEVSKVGSTTGGFLKIYINTSNSLIGAVSIAQYAIGSAIFVKIQRQFNINEGAINGIVFSSNVVSDISAQNFIYSSTVFNPTIDNYIITTGKLSLASESIQQRGFCVTN